MAIKMEMVIVDLWRMIVGVNLIAVCLVSQASMEVYFSNLWRTDCS